jgi:hypothetical protein
MGWFIIITILIYIIMSSYTAKRYYLRRHGVTPQRGEPGTSTAGMIGLLWPITLFLESVREPTRCSHHRHVLERARIMEEIGVVDQQRNIERSFQRAPQRDVRTSVRPAASGRAEPEPAAADPRPVDAATLEDDVQDEAMKAWLLQLEDKRSPLSTQLTDALLNEVGAPPLPPKYGTPYTQVVFKYAAARTFANEMAKRYSRQAWLSFGKAEKDNDPKAMELAHAKAEFWTYVHNWFEQL